MRYHRIYYLIAIPIMLFCACQGNKPVDLTQGKAPTAQIGKVDEKSLSSFITLPGQLIPYQQVDIFPKVSSFVTDVKVDRGSMVHKGETLILLEAPELNAQLQSARSRYAQAMEVFEDSREKYERLKVAAQTAGSVALMDLDNAQSKMKADSAVVQSEKSNEVSLESMLGYLVVRAPFDGVITERNVHPGALVGPASKSGDLPMLVLQQLSRQRLVVYIPEFYTGSVDLSQKAKYTFNAFPGKVFEGNIARSSNSLNSTIRSEAVEIDVYNTDKNFIFKPGMFAEVKIPLLSGSKSLIVPSKAVVTSTERKFVVTLQNGKAHLVDVKEGIVQGDSIEVFGDLKGGEDILLNATDETREGTAVQ